jgi:hypothetical protein
MPQTRESGRVEENRGEAELELELIQTHLTQKPLLWVEVGAHAVRKRGKAESVGVPTVYLAKKHPHRRDEKKDCNHCSGPLDTHFLQEWMAECVAAPIVDFRNHFIHCRSKILFHIDPFLK